MDDFYGDLGLNPNEIHDLEKAADELLRNSGKLIREEDNESKTPVVILPIWAQNSNMGEEEFLEQKGANYRPDFLEAFAADDSQYGDQSVAVRAIMNPIVRRHIISALLADDYEHKHENPHRRYSFYFSILDFDKDDLEERERIATEVFGFKSWATAAVSLRSAAESIERSPEVKNVVHAAAPYFEYLQGFLPLANTDIESIFAVEAAPQLRGVILHDVIAGLWYVDDIEKIVMAGALGLMQDPKSYSKLGVDVFFKSPDMGARLSEVKYRAYRKIGLIHPGLLDYIAEFDQNITEVEVADLRREVDEMQGPLARFDRSYSGKGFLGFNRLLAADPSILLRATTYIKKYMNGGYVYPHLTGDDMNMVLLYTLRDYPSTDIASMLGTSPEEMGNIVRAVKELARDSLYQPDFALQPDADRLLAKVKLPEASVSKGKDRDTRIALFSRMTVMENSLPELRQHPALKDYPLLKGVLQRLVSGVELGRIFAEHGIATIDTNGEESRSYTHLTFHLRRYILDNPLGEESLNNIAVAVTQLCEFTALDYVLENEELRGLMSFILTKVAHVAARTLPASEAKMHLRNIHAVLLTPGSAVNEVNRDAIHDFMKDGHVDEKTGDIDQEKLYALLTYRYGQKMQHHRQYRPELVEQMLSIYSNRTSTAGIISGARNMAIRLATHVQNNIAYRMSQGATYDEARQIAIGSIKYMDPENIISLAELYPVDKADIADLLSKWRNVV